MKKPTLTIGIPAHNEEENIGVLLGSIKKQCQKHYTLERIIVALDGCTDSTSEIVKKCTRNDKHVVLIDDSKRMGKAKRLNMIYKKSQSDFLLTFDADVVLDTKHEIDYMFGKMFTDKRIYVVGGRFIPAKQTTLMGKFSILSYLMFEDAMLKLNDGNNMFSLVGAASLIKKKIYKTFQYPEKTISDQNYLYMMATENNPHGVQIAKNTRIYLATVSTFKDWRILGTRSTTADRKNVIRFFGKGVLKNYTMPKSLFFSSILSFFLKSPMYATGAVIMNIYIRKFPYPQGKPRKGIWTLTQSSKHLLLT